MCTKIKCIRLFIFNNLWRLNTVWALLDKVMINGTIWCFSTLVEQNRKAFFTQAFVSRVNKMQKCGGKGQCDWHVAKMSFSSPQASAPELKSKLSHKNVHKQDDLLLMFLQVLTVIILDMRPYHLSLTMSQINNNWL